MLCRGKVGVTFGDSFLACCRGPAMLSSLRMSCGGCCIDSCWFWLKVSHWLPLAFGARIGLRKLGRTAAEVACEPPLREERR
eukprot:6443575-Amphidinium_carterae.1